jgi:diketogulonate reductase-like aldo/keto reductase
MNVTTVGGDPVSPVGLGTWRLTGASCRRSVETALELGYRHVDTAQEYDNERQVGDAIRNSEVDRDDIFLTTKLGKGNRGHDAVHRSIEESLAKLGTDHVDLLLIHWPNLITPLGGTLSAMNDLVESGAVRYIGVSNFDHDRLARARELSEHPIAVNQVQYNPYWPQAKLLDYCRIHDVLVTAYSPLAHGGVLDDPVLEAIGTRHGKTPAQVAIRWLVQQPGVVTVPKATSRQHLEENLDVFGFELTDAEMNRVHQPSKTRAVAGFIRGRLRDLGPR